MSSSAYGAPQARMENSAAQFFLALAICAAFTTIANARVCSDTQGAPGATGNVVRLEKSANAMGTTYILDLYGANRSTLQTAAQEAFDELHKLDQMLSNYISGSELSRVNDHAADG